MQVDWTGPHPVALGALGLAPLGHRGLSALERCPSHFCQKPRLPEIQGLSCHLLRALCRWFWGGGHSIAVREECFMVFSWNVGCLHLLLVWEVWCVCVCVCVCMCTHVCVCFNPMSIKEQVVRSRGGILGTFSYVHGCVGKLLKGPGSRCVMPCGPPGLCRVLYTASVALGPK